MRAIRGRQLGLPLIVLWEPELNWLRESLRAISRGLERARAIYRPMVVEPTVWHAPLINYADKTPLINMAMDSFQSRLNLLFTWHTSRDMKSVVFAVIKLLPAPEQQSQVIEILRWVGDLTRPEPGCLGCWLSEEGPFCDEIQYVEQWDLDETMHEHIRSDLYARVLAAMVSRQSPEVGFHYVTEEKGIELIETLRTADVPKVEHSFSQGVAP